MAVAAQAHPYFVLCFFQLAHGCYEKQRWRLLGKIHTNNHTNTQIITFSVK
jgi:hypothetical protein